LEMNLLVLILVCIVKDINSCNILGSCNLKVSSAFDLSVNLWNIYIKGSTTFTTRVLELATSRQIVLEVNLAISIWISTIPVVLDTDFNIISVAN